MWIAAALTAFFIKGLCGFANTLIFTSLLGFRAENAGISPVELVLGYPSNLILTWKERKSLNPHIYLPLILLVLSGSIPGAFLLKNINAESIRMICGAVIVLIGVEMLFRERGSLRAKGSKTVLILTGILAGVMCGLFGIGALLAAYVSRTAESGSEFKANISAVFAADNTFRLILYASLGILTPETLKTSLMLMPFMLAGLFAGIAGSRVLNEKTVKKLVIILLIFSGAALTAKAIAAGGLNF